MLAPTGPPGQNCNVKLKLESCGTASHVPCPHCNAKIGFYKFSGMGDMAPHFYCDRCSNVFFDRRHRDLVRTGPLSKQVQTRIADDLPACPCGGRFQPGANPKCPTCRRELPHTGPPELRLQDPFAIVVEGAHLVTPEDDE